jgi:tRNA A-37 threonylcarbamoyl transferase component Bud32
MSASRIVDVCPGPDELTSFQLGDLPADRLETIAEHLRACRTCEAKMQALAEPADDLLLSLRELAGSELGPEELAPEDLAVAALSVGGAGATPEPTAEPEERLEQVREYRVLEKLGQGGMGTVFRAEHSRLGRIVALKILRDRRHRSPDLVARFRREMKAVGMLDHPNIVRATDAGEWQGTEYLVMEFVDGIDAGNLVRRLGPVPVVDACEIVRQAALGLAHAHAHGMVHRDVKPSNLLLSVHGVVKLTDLGLVRSAVEDAGPSTTSHYVLGSLEYMAPEQADDPHSADARADLYALGCTLYELLAGRPPFSDIAHRTVLQKLKAHASAPVPPLCELRADIPRALAAVVEKLLAKNPAERVASAGELAGALAPWAAGANLQRLLKRAEQTLPPDPAARRPAVALTNPVAADPATPRRRFLWAGVLLAAVLALLAGTVIYVQTDQGVVEIVTSDDDVKVSVEKGGKVIEILDLREKKTYRLESGKYELKVVSGEKDFEIKPNSLTLTRGKTEIVRIRRLDDGQVAKAQWPPLDKDWLQKTSRLAPKERADEIVKELVRRNPGYDGKGVTTRVEDGKLSLIFTQGAKLLDLTPVRAGADLGSVGVFSGDTADLSPLRGLSLTGIDLANTKVTDLSPLKGMSLKYVNLNNSQGIKDLTPLIGQHVELLDVSGTSVSDLAPLKLMPGLSVFSCFGTKVTDLGPLAGVKTLTVLNCSDLDVSDLKPLEKLTQLTHLELANTKVKDLRPLAKLPLKYLNIQKTPATDLSPLRNMKALEKLICDFDAARDGEILRSLPKLTHINGKPKKDVLP